MKRILILLLLPISCFATKHYVANAGSDITGTGTLINPWKTIYKASTVLNTPGDTIMIPSETFIETATCNIAEGVSIYGQGNSSVIKSTLTADWYHILEFSSGSEGTAGNQSISYVKFDGQSLSTSVGVVISGRKNIEIHHITCIDFKRVGISFSGIVNWLGADAPVIYATGNSFHDNVVNNCSTWIQAQTYGTGCVQFGGQRNFQCYNNTVTQPTRGTGGKGIGWPLKMANEGHLDSLYIFNNIITKEPFTGNYGGDSGFNFVSEFWNVTNVFMYNNIMQGAADFANVNGMKFYGNTIAQPAIPSHYEDGLFLETNEINVEVYNNYFKKLSTGFSIAPHDYNNVNYGVDVNNIYVHNNRFEDMGIQGGGQGMAIRSYNAAGDIIDTFRISNYRIKNNTFTAATGGNACIIGIQLPSYVNNGGYSGPVNAHNIVVDGNIIQGFSYAGIQANPGATIDTLSEQYNLFYNNGTDVLYATSSPTHLTTSNSLNADPLFLSNLYLNALSPAKGSNISGKDRGWTYDSTTPPPGNNIPNNFRAKFIFIQ